MHAVLVDTDIAMDYLRGSRKAADLIGPLWKSDRVYISILSVYELYTVMKPAEAEDTERFIDACHIDTVTLAIAKQAGEIHQEWRAKGVTLTSVDCLVAATATINGRKIATRNKNHYPQASLLP